jgi:hypothetical protein
MLTREKQERSYELVKLLCRGTNLEGKEYLCVKYRYDTEYRRYTDDDIDFNANWDRIFAVAIVDDTPIWLEEPFTVYDKVTNIAFSYRSSDRRLVGKGTDLLGQPTLTVSIPIENAIWGSFTLKNAEDATPDSKQVGGTHYKDKAIQPWAYMEANFTKEEFVGFLRGNAHKYLDRYKDKNGIEDLKKDIHYIEKLIQVVAAAQAA